MKVTVTDSANSRTSPSATARVTAVALLSALPRAGSAKKARFASMNGASSNHSARAPAPAVSPPQEYASARC
jgi:hypothetical protein